MRLDMARSSAKEDHRYEALPEESDCRPVGCWLQDCLIGRKDIVALEAIWLPVVEVSVWAGISKENKKKMVEGLTKALEELGIPREAVTVIIYEAPKSNWATGGQLHSEKYADM
jgi:4-oxalocrotonate tautomerase